MAEKCTKHTDQQHPHHPHHHSTDENPSGHDHHGKNHSWNAKEYDQKVMGMNYNGPRLIVEHFDSFNMSKESKIIDLAAGTGLVGAILSDSGYIHVDALDGSAEMLAGAKEKQCYENIITHFITKGTKLPIDDHSYDHIVMCGSLCHIDYESLPQIIRICKPGGIICWAIGMSEDLIRIEPKFSNGQFENYIESLCEQKLWEFLPGYPKKVNSFYMDRAGWVYAMKVL